MKDENVNKKNVYFIPTLITGISNKFHRLVNKNNYWHGGLVYEDA